MSLYVSYVVVCRCLYSNTQRNETKQRHNSRNDTKTNPPNNPLYFKGLGGVGLCFGGFWGFWFVSLVSLCHCVIICRCVTVCICRLVIICLKTTKNDVNKNDTTPHRQIHETQQRNIQHIPTTHNPNKSTLKESSLGFLGFLKVSFVVFSLI